MKSPFVLAVVSVLLFTGCTTQVWYQPGKTSAEAYQDFGDCQMQALNSPVTTTRALSGLGMYLNQQQAHDSYLKACMLSKGYQQVGAHEVPNGPQYPK